MLASLSYLTSSLTRHLEPICTFSIRLNGEFLFFRSLHDDRELVKQVFLLSRDVLQAFELASKAALNANFVMTARSLLRLPIGVLVKDEILVVAHNRGHLVRQRIENIPWYLSVHHLCRLARDTHE